MPLATFKKLFADPWSWRSSEFFRHSSVLISGAGFAQLIPFLLSPVIARLYFPDDFAVLAAYTSVTIVLSIIATGMYSSALMIDDTDEKALNTAMAAFIVSIGTALLSLILVLLFRKWLAALTGNPNVLFYLLFIPLTVLFAGGSQTLIIWNNRKKQYKRLATNRVIQVVTASIITLLLGFAGYHRSGLIVGLLFSQAAAFLVLLFQSWQSERAMFIYINPKAIKQSFKTHINFPKYNMPQGFLDGFRESSILMLISNYFGAATLGAYSFALSILNKPLQVIVQPVAQVFYQQAATLDRENKSLKQITGSIILVLFTLFLPLLIIITLWGNTIFGFVFGKEWIEAGRFAQIMIVWMLFRFVNSPLSGIPMIYNKQKTFFYFGAVNNLSLPLALFIAGFTNQAFISGLTALVICGSLNMLAQIIWILYLNKKRKN